MLECVINVSEGRRADVIATIAAAAGPALLDIHSDPDHHRSVITVADEAPARAVVAAALDRIDLTQHTGVHPRLGAVDVVPFVPLAGSTLDDAIGARDRLAAWLGTARQVPCFSYGPERTLPEIRSQAFASLAPDTGPPHPHPRVGATAVGARPVLVAFNVWLAKPEFTRAREIARELRGPAVRALGLAVGDGVQVSMNLVAPADVGPDAAFDAVAARARVARAELVGLLPADVLGRIPRHRWHELDLAEDRTIEARMAAAGVRPR